MPLFTGGLARWCPACEGSGATKNEPSTCPHKTGEGCDRDEITQKFDCNQCTSPHHPNHDDPYGFDLDLGDDDGLGGFVLLDPDDFVDKK